jgi:hypothetical protein
MQARGLSGLARDAEPAKSASRAQSSTAWPVAEIDGTKVRSAWHGEPVAVPLGEVARAMGDVERALVNHAEAHMHASKIGQQLEQARACAGLGHEHRELGDLDQAREHGSRPSPCTTNSAYRRPTTCASASKR